MAQRREVAMFPRDVFKYDWREKEFNASQEAPFETLQLSMKPLRVSTLISKRSSGLQPAISSRYRWEPYIRAQCTLLHLTAVGCSLN